MKNWDFNDINASEKWDIYFSNGEKAPYTKTRSDVLEDYEFHLVVRIWIVNSQKQILLSQRGKNKRGPLLWECTGGSALSGETGRDAINREVFEELGIDLSNDDGICMKKERRDSHHDFYEIWLFRKDIALSTVSIDGEEVINVKWVGYDEFLRMMENDELMPTLSNFPQLYEKFVK